MFEFGSPAFCRLREAFWRAAFEEAARERRSFIFTFAPEKTVRRGLIDELASIVTDAGGSVSFVELVCEQRELERRTSSPERLQLGKIGSATQYRQLQADGAFAFAAMPPPGLRIRTDEVAPPESARRIEEALRLQRYPPLDRHCH